MSRYKIRHVNEDGFALVLALSLMAFVLVLLLTITTFTQVESANANQAKSHALAQQNALLGLQMALGELQQELGPDQRVSATATRLDTDASDAEGYDDVGGFTTTDGLNPARQNWTGVWAVGTDTNDTVQTGFRKWLVSGYDSTHVPTGADVLTSASAFAQPQILMEGDAPVEAGLEVIDSSSNGIGRFAYWVGDEGVKAKVNLKQSTTGNESISAQYSELSTMTNFDWLSAGSGDSFEKYVSAPQFKLLASTSGDTSGDSVLKHIHDVTFDSFSVLSNSVSGGLKRDLTSALYDTIAQPSGLMFDPVGSAIATDEDPGGPAWEQLRSWVQTQADVSGRLPIQASSKTQAGVYPILTGFQLYWVPTYDSATGVIRMNILPAVTLWNPYNMPLQPEEYTIKFGRTLMVDSGFQNLTGLWHNWKLQLTRNDSAGGSNAERSMTKNDPATFHLNSGVLQPGEAVVFSAPEGTSAYDFSNPSSAADLVRGYRSGSGFYYNTGLQWNTGELDHVFGYDAASSRVHSVELSKESSEDTASADRLQAAVYINDYPVNVGFTGTRVMKTNPVDDAALSLSDLNTVEGFKILHTFIDNLSVWGSGAYVLPNTRAWLRNQNPRALMMGPVPLIFNGSYFVSAWSATLNPSFVGGLQRGNGELSTGFEPSSGDRVSVGFSEDVSAADRTILFQAAPTRANLQSIGQLMHAPLYNDSENDASETLEDYIRNTRFSNLIPAYAVGNSLADPFIALGEVSRDWASSYTPGDSSEARFFSFEGIHYDYSYKLNEALWDDYFFSSLPNTSSGSVPHNSRLVGSVTATDPLEIEQQAAADLLLDGGFNINSTSVEAWKALLASFYGADVDRIDGPDDLADLADPESPILRLDIPAGGSSSDPDEDDEESYVGYRSLTANQIKSLAEAIVEQVKLRGPFGGMAQFVNRMPTRDAPVDMDVDSFRLKGALAAAIENTNINASLKGSNLEVEPSGIYAVETKAEAGWRTEGLPGWLSQADLLARLGAVMTARSDTFRIRAYGEYENPASGALASACCEAIVQRIPEYVDSAAKLAWEDVAAGSVNELYGRRFIIIDFKWLEDDEI